jgi:cell division transport system permease protein
MIKGIKRIIKGGFLNFRRNGTISLAGVLQVVNALSVITFIILLQGALHFALNEMKDKVDVTIYFNVGAPESQILALKSSIEKLPEVASTSYTSDANALALFRSRHESDYPTIAALDEIGTNPLGASLNIKAKEVSQYESIANFLKSDSVVGSGPSSIIDKVNYYQNKVVIDKLNSSISDTEKLGFFLMLYLIISSIIITFNTIRLTIFISKEEIGVMRLVGASKMHVRGPFMIEGAIYGILGTIITLIIFFPLSRWLAGHIDYFRVFNIYDYYVSNFFAIFGLVLFSGLVLSVISSFFATRKYLNK